MLLLLFLLFTLSSSTLLRHDCDFTVPINRTTFRNSENCFRIINDASTQTNAYVFLHKTELYNMSLKITIQTLDVCETVYDEAVLPQSYDNVSGWPRGYTVEGGVFNGGNVYFVLRSTQDFFFMEFDRVTRNLTVAGSLEFDPNNSYVLDYGANYVFVSILIPGVESKLLRYPLADGEFTQYSTGDAELSFWYEIVGDHAVIFLSRISESDSDLWYVDMDTGLFYYRIGNFSNLESLEVSYYAEHGIFVVLSDLEIIIYGSNLPFYGLASSYLPIGEKTLALDRLIVTTVNNCSTVGILDFSEWDNMKEKNHDIVPGDGCDELIPVELPRYNIMQYSEKNYFLVPIEGNPRIWLNDPSISNLESFGDNSFVMVDNTSINTYEMTDDLTNLEVLLSLPIDDAEFIVSMEFHRNGSTCCVIQDHLLNCHFFQTVTPTGVTEEVISTANMETNEVTNMETNEVTNMETNEVTNMETNEITTMETNEVTAETMSADTSILETTEENDFCIVYAADCDSPGTALITGSIDISDVVISGESVMVKRSTLSIRGSTVKFEGLDLEDSSLRLEYPSGLTIENELNIVNSNLTVDLDESSVEQIQKNDQLLIPAGSVVGEFKEVSILVDGEETLEVSVTYEDNGVYLSHNKDTFWIILGVSISVVVVVVIILTIVLVSKKFLCASDT